MRAKPRVMRQLEWVLGYEEYKQGPVWADKRKRVLERARWICEGCGLRRAEEVHHLRYPEGERPGSAGWERREKLYDLVALCKRCHFEVHEVELQNRGALKYGEEERAID